MKIVYENNILYIDTTTTTKSIENTLVREPPHVIKFDELVIHIIKKH